VVSVPPNWRCFAELRPALVAAVSGRSRRTIERMIENGRLPSRKAAGCRLVPIQAVLELVGEAENERGDHAARWNPKTEQRVDEILDHFNARHG